MAIVEPHYDFSIGVLKILNQEYEACIKQFEKLDTDQLLNELEQWLDGQSYNSLESRVLASSKESIEKKSINDHDLQRILGYTKFIKNKGISVEPLRLEYREEGPRAYLLVPVSQSFILQLMDTKLVWVHDEIWAKERFIDKKLNSGPYLCGQQLGLSKFVSLSKEMGPQTLKESALVALGLKGYAAFDKPGFLYLIVADTNDDILKLAQPKVPILYKVMEKETGKWSISPHFGENSIPGFTSGGKSEVVINTFQVDAMDKSDLDKKGVRVYILGDSNK